MNTLKFFKRSHMVQTKGFTLIELLVVIATIVLSSLNSARNKSKDSAIKQMIASSRSDLELFSLAKNTYNGFDTSPKGLDYINNITKKYANANPTFTGDKNTFTFQATLTNGTDFCADHQGYAGPCGDSVASVSTSGTLRTSSSSTITTTSNSTSNSTPPPRHHLLVMEPGELAQPNYV